MLSWLALALVAPPLALVVVYGVIVVVALCRAEAKDVPEVLKESAGVFGRLAERLPQAPRWRRSLEETTEPGSLAAVDAEEER